MSNLKNRIRSLLRSEFELALKSVVAGVLPPASPDLMAAAHEILAVRHNLAQTLLTQMPAAADGSPVPWYTYPAIEYLNSLNADGLRMFEYSCGSSSLFWARKGARIWSVEHNPEWHEKMRTKSLHLQALLLRSDKDGYARSIGEIGGQFDIISIDGAWREACLEAALPYLEEDGLLILDNSDWYPGLLETIRDHGFFRIDFNGFGPCNQYCWTTSLAFRMKTRFISRLSQPHPIGGIEIARGELY